MDRHLRWGWSSLAVFVALGIALEVLHAFKSGLYLDVTNEARRLMWTLAHAHGTLIALVQLGFAAAVDRFPNWPTRSRTLASRILCAAGVLMPAGFFLGGIATHGGDPGIGVVLVPPGGLLLLTAVILTARAVRSR